MIIMEDENEINVRLFKLTYSGTLIESKIEDLISLINVNNILAIHGKRQKRMYIWVGLHASQSLQNLISKIRVITSREYSDLVTLRYMNIDSGKEPDDFFEMISMPKEEIRAKVEYQEKILLPKLAEITELKGKADDLFMAEDFDEVIEISKKLIKLAEDIGDESLKLDQEEFIKEAKARDKEKNFMIKLDDKTVNIKNKFEELIKAEKIENIIEAHKIVEEFKNEYSEDIDLTTVPLANELIKKDERKWTELQVEQENISTELVKLESNITKFKESNELPKAEEDLNRATELLDRCINDGLREKWKIIKVDLLKVIKKDEISQQVDNSLEESNKLTEGKQFEEAIQKLDSILEEVISLEFFEHKEKLEEKKKEITSLQEEHEKSTGKIAELEKKIEDEQRNESLNAIVKHCEIIIPICESSNKSDLVEKYSSILENAKVKIEEREKKVREEQEELMEKVKEIESIVEIEEDTLPMIEEFSVNELIGDLSENIGEVLEQVGALLEDHRVEVKKEIKNTAMLVSASGEVVELDKNLEIRQPEEPKEEVKYNVQSGFENPFDDVIEEAILTDLIPYNFEITNIELNGKTVEELPDKTLTKEGMELKWQLQNVPPKEKIEINYDLRRRVSRTIIFLVEGELKIIKTHANLSTIELQGFYDAKLPFTNSFGKVLNGVVVEDIIPLYYLHFVKAPTNVLPAETSRSKQGELVKWNVGKMEAGTINYQYRLVELFRLEELKVDLTNIRKEAKDSIDKGDLTEALMQYEKVINQLEEFNK